MIRPAEIPSLARFSVARKPSWGCLANRGRSAGPVVPRPEGATRDSPGGAPGTRAKMESLVLRQSPIEGVSRPQEIHSLALRACKTHQSNVDVALALKGPYRCKA